MKTPSAFWLRLLLVSLPAGAAPGQSTIHPSDRHAFAANAGWLDFRPSAPDGVRVSETYFSGYAYAANFGWIHFGDGSPVNGHSYSNLSAGDHGVNLRPDGSLEGRAYSANTGWITFEANQGQPRLDLLTGIFSGAAYSANLGWIPLATSSSALATDTLACPDSDNDGIADSYEYLHFNNLTTATSVSDSDGDGFSDREEYEANTDPNDRADFFRILSHTHSLGAPASTTLDFTSRPGRVYRVQHDSDLVGTWTFSSAGPFLTDAGGQTSRTIPHPNPGRNFFRVVVSKPLQP